jgi:hypothetical protein
LTGTSFSFCNSWIVLYDVDPLPPRIGMLLRSLPEERQGLFDLLIALTEYRFENTFGVEEREEISLSECLRRNKASTELLSLTPLEGP